MAQAANPSAAKPVSPPSTSAGNGKLRWVLGWIVLPGTIIAALFLAGVHVGARHPDRGLARLLLKMFGGEAGVATEPEQSSSPQLRPGGKPGEPFSLVVSLQPKQMDAIADKSLGLSADELDCEHVCRAYYNAEFDLAVYAIEQCELARAVSHMPSLLSCSGKLEASERTESAPSESAPSDR